VVTMGWFDSPEKKEKREQLSKLKTLELKKIANRKNIDVSGYTKREIVEEILDLGISLKMIKNYSGLSKMIKAKAGKIKATEGNVKKLLLSWKPPILQGESQYKFHLYSYLKKRMGPEVVRKESGEYRADITVRTHKNKQVPIELKFNFSRQSIDRIDRQIREFKSDKNYKGHKIYILVIGKKNDDGWGMWYPRHKKDRRLKIIVKNKREITKSPKSRKKRIR
jgi:hypothetical protein